MTDTPTFTKAQRQALELLARGGARYGTRVEVMKELKAMGLCAAHQNSKGRWVWRPTEKGWKAVAATEATTQEARP